MITRVLLSHRPLQSGASIGIGLDNDARELGPVHLPGTTATAGGRMALCVGVGPPLDEGMITSTADTSPARIDLYWIPLGAGGSGFVRFNGRVYEAVKAMLERRGRCAIYHTALQVHLPEGHFVVETTWPSPDAETWSRGVVREGAVGSRRLARLRTFRYEVRRWRNGVLPDADEAVGGPQRVSNEAEQARSLLEETASVPVLIWGRDQLKTGEMVLVPWPSLQLSLNGGYLSVTSRKA